ncbi:hypothetical protein GGR23_000811 [Gellertiella hungarica]|uniref:Uncharacterized protein n=1 Tax=Gellertiella hungarica TaxID=1572859 RepID=A0A7W6NIS8_9HYPH|nr:hypothetical protein [Gellertiella hungarica]
MSADLDAIAQRAIEHRTHDNRKQIGRPAK